MPASESDGQLVRRFLKTRDESDFAHLMQRHGPMVYGVCLRRLGQSHDAEDAAQAVFLMLVDKAARLRRRDSIAGWLHKAAMNVCQHARRAQAIRARHEQQAAQMQMQSAQSDANPFAGIDAERLDQQIQALPRRYRLPVILHHLEGRSHEEGAALLGVPVGTFSGRLSRARQILKANLQPQSAQSNNRGSVLGALAIPMPAHLVASTARVAAGSAAATPTAAALTLGGLHVLHVARIKLIAFLIAAPLALAGIGYGATVLVRQAENVATPARLVIPPQAPAAAQEPQAVQPSTTRPDDHRIHVLIKIPPDQSGTEERE